MRARRQAYQRCRRASLPVAGLLITIASGLTLSRQAWGQTGSQAIATPDSHRRLINKQVGNEQWAITRNGDGTVTGNVSRPDEPAVFLWCSENSRTADLVQLSCFASPTDDAAPCATDLWAPLGDVTLPISFFSDRRNADATPVRRVTPDSAGPAASTSRRQLTPDGLRVLINKDVGNEHWAITLNTNDQTISGNVLSAAGVHFLSCSRASDDGSDDPDAIQVTYACAAGTPCSGPTCAEDQWDSIGNVQLPGSFLAGSRCGGASRLSAEGFVAYLAAQMDRFHDRFIVYEDVSSAGNHFLTFGKIPNANSAVAIDGSWSDDPHSGATAIRFSFDDSSFGGFYFMNGVLSPKGRAPTVNFGTIPNAGIDLTGATKLTFWARGERGGEKIDFFVAGVGRDAASGAAIAPFPDSSRRQPARGSRVELTRDWKRYEIDVSKLDLSYVLGGFAWVADHAHNPSGAVFFVDDIEYTLAPTARQKRLQQPRFIVSFETDPSQPDPFDANEDDDIDLVLRNLAFSYDNALALLAFLADGSSNALARARLIGDAFVYAGLHDRSFTDGRIRTAYQAGDLSLPPGWAPNDRSGTVPVSGFFSEARQEFYEVEQGSIDVGNNAWVMIALLALHARTGEPSYLDAARRIGEFLLTFRNDEGTYQGFFGRILDAETDSPMHLRFASVEHNLDVASAFRVIGALENHAKWLEAADHAQAFVEAMWDPSIGCYRAGTTDPSAQNQEQGQLPLDVHPWSLLAIPALGVLHPDTLACPERFHRTEQDGFFGFDFNDGPDGVWFEGTGHMATAYAAIGRFADARVFREELRRAQSTAPFGEFGGLAAASHDGVSSGFDFKLFRRRHIGATSWGVFGELGFNPYRQVWAAE